MALGVVRTHVWPHLRTAIGGVEFGPLVGGEDGAGAEHEVGLFFLDGGAGVGDPVHLRSGPGFIEGGTTEERLELEALLGEGGMELNELHSGLHGEVVEAFGLIGGEAEAGDELGVLPEFAVGAPSFTVAVAAVVVPAGGPHVRTHAPVLVATLPAVARALHAAITVGLPDVMHGRGRGGLIVRDRRCGLGQHGERSRKQERGCERVGFQWSSPTRHVPRKGFL